MKSIMQQDKKCFLCGSRNNLELHHVFGGASRGNSTKYGLTVYLCHNCHNEPGGVHFDRKKMDSLRAEAEAKFKEAYPDLDFMAIFHRHYEADPSEPKGISITDIEDLTKELENGQKNH